MNLFKTLFKKKRIKTTTVKEDLASRGSTKETPSNAREIKVGWEIVDHLASLEKDGITQRVGVKDSRPDAREMEIGWEIVDHLANLEKDGAKKL